MRAKRAALGISLLLLICTGVFFLVYSVKSAAMSDCVLTEKKYQKILKTLALTEDDILTELCFQEEALPCDRESGTFYLPVDMDTEEWEEGHFTSGDSSVTVYLLDNPLSDDKAQAIREGKVYRVLAVKGSVYREYSLVFTGLPVLSIETDEEIRYDEVYGNMKLYQAGTKQDWVLDSFMSGHIRGGSSRLNPKKSYKISLYKHNQTGAGELRKNKVSLLGMREDDDWILYAIYSEDTKVRDKLSIDIWNNSGALANDSQGYYGYHMEYIELFQNGVYCGLYGLMERVDYKQLALTQAGEAQQPDYLYKQKDPEVYELKGDYSSEDEENFEVLNAYLECLNAEDEVFAEKIGDIIDVDSALEVWIYLQAVMGMDNTARNIFYPVVYEDGQYRMYFLPWDMDYSWGNVHDFDALNRSRFSEEILTMRISWKLGDRLIRLDVDGAREKVARRWKELRSSVYSDSYLQEQIDAAVHQVIDSGAFYRDERTWVDSQHSEDYEGLKTLACERMDFLDEYMEDLLSYLDIEEYVE
jgi:hypothetical protein